MATNEKPETGHGDGAREPPSLRDAKPDVGPGNGDLIGQSRTCPIVGIGASAGGLEAFTQLLQALPVDTGMAFVLIQHLDPTHTSFLTEALGRATKMRVTQVADGMGVAPNHV